MRRRESPAHPAAVAGSGRYGDARAHQVGRVGPATRSTCSIPNSPRATSSISGARTARCAAAARAAAAGQPLRSADRRTDRGQQRRDHVFSGARAARPDSGGAAQPGERSADPRAACTLEQSAGTVTGLDVAQQETAVAMLNAAHSAAASSNSVRTVNALAVLVGKTPESIDVNSGTLERVDEPRRRSPACPRSCCRAGRTSPQPSSSSSPPTPTSRSPAPRCFRASI